MVDVARNAFSRNVSPQTAPSFRQAGLNEPQGDPDRAEQFASALARHKEGKNKGKTESGAPDAPTSPAGLPSSLAEPMVDRTKTKDERKTGGAEIANCAAAENGLGPDTLPDTRSPDASTAASQELSAQFAARLALPHGGIAQSHIQLDERLYAHFHIVVKSEADQGLSISYETSADADSNQPNSEENLRRRLEARGLTIETIAEVRSGDAAWLPHPAARNR